jgi:hypothetical protein
MNHTESQNTPTTPASWLRARKQAAARERTARNRAEAADASHRAKLRRLLGIPNAVRARLATQEHPATRRGIIVRIWARTMAEVVWDGISSDAPGEIWQLSELEVAE